MTLSNTVKSTILGLVLFAAAGLIANTSKTEAASTATANTPVVTNALQHNTRTVVYYFHGNMRCFSCRKIETYTMEAIRTGFAEALENGRLELKSVNVEEPANEHFVQDFQLFTRSVVLERRVGDLRQEWKNLDKVWRLTRNKEDFISYVQKETLKMMRGT